MELITEGIRFSTFGSLLVVASCNWSPVVGKPRQKRDEHRGLIKADGFIRNQLTKPDIFCLWHFDCYSTAFGRFLGSSLELLAGLSLKIAFLNLIFLKYWIRLF